MIFKKREKGKKDEKINRKKSDIERLNIILEKLESNIDSSTLNNSIYKNLSPLLRKEDSRITINENLIQIDNKYNDYSFRIEAYPSLNNFNSITIYNMTDNGKKIEIKNINFSDKFIIINSEILESILDNKTNLISTIRRAKNFQLYLNNNLVYDSNFESVTSTLDTTRCYTKKIETYILKNKEAIRKISSTAEDESLWNTGVIYGKSNAIDGITYGKRKTDANFYMHPMEDITLEEYINFLKLFQREIIDLDEIRHLKKKMSNN